MTLQPQVVVFRNREQQVRIPGMKLELVDALPVADEVFDAAHGGRAEDPNDSAKSGSCEKWLSSL